MSGFIYVCCGLIALMALAAFPLVFVVVLVGLLGWALLALVF